MALFNGERVFPDVVQFFPLKQNPNFVTEGAMWYNVSAHQFEGVINGIVTPIGGSGGIGGTIASTQVAVGNGANTVAGSSFLVWSSSNGDFILTNPAGGVNSQRIILVPGTGISFETILNARQDGSLLIQPSGGPFVTMGGAGVQISSSTAVQNQVQFSGSTSGQVAIGSASVAGTPNRMNLPVTTGSAGQVLSTDGNNPQQLSWITPSAATIGGSIAVNQVAVGSGSNTIAGSSNWTNNGNDYSLTLSSGANLGFESYNHTSGAWAWQTGNGGANPTALFELALAGVLGGASPAASFGRTGSSSWLDIDADNTAASAVSSTGTVRFNKSGTMKWRNNANSADLLGISLSATDQLTWGTNVLGSRVILNQGTQYSGADAAIVPNANWGTGPTVSNAAGTDQALKFTITAGTTPNSTPGVTITFKDGAWANPPLAVAIQNGGIGSGNIALLSTSTTTTTATITYMGTPIAGSNYTFTLFLWGI